MNTSAKPTDAGEPLDLRGRTGGDMTADTPSPRLIAGFPRLLTRAEVAEALHWSVGTIDNLIRAGRLPAVRLVQPTTREIVRRGRDGQERRVTVTSGGSVRIDPRDLETFIAAGKGTT